MNIQLLFIPIAFAFASCQVNSSLKRTPVVGQIATTANHIVGQDDKNETASLFTPKNFKKQKYGVSDISSSAVSDKPNSLIPEPTEAIFPEAYRMYSGVTPQQQRSFIYACASRIDENYLEWLEDYVTGRASLDTGFGILSQALSAAATIFTPASTVRVLSGTSTFVQGVNSSIESKFFMSLTVLQQVPAMNKQRIKARKALDNYVKGNDFQLSSAIALLDNLFMAGTQFTALGEAPSAGAEEE